MGEVALGLMPACLGVSLSLSWHWHCLLEGLCAASKGTAVKHHCCVGTGVLPGTELCGWGRAAFATLGYHPSGDLLDRLGHHAAGIVRTFRPQATSNALW